MLRLTPLADEADLEAFVALHARAFREDHLRYGAGPPGYEDLAWHRALSARVPYRTIEVDGRLVGGIVAEEQAADRVFLHILFVDPERHGQGIGRAAVGELERQMPHARRWSLYTPYGTLRNHRFYESLGYVKRGEVPIDNVSGLEAGFRLFVYEKVVG